MEEVCVADRAGLDDSGKDDEELENNAASKNDEGDQAEDGTLRRLSVLLNGRKFARVGLRLMAMASVLWSLGANGARELQ